MTGDCADDVIVLDGPMRRVLVLSMSGRALRAIANQTTTLALDVVVGDFDAEGSRELAILGEGGRVTLWQP